MVDNEDQTFIVPVDILYEPIGPHAKMVYVALCADKLHGYCDSSIERLAILTSVSTPIVRRALYELERAGWIERDVIKRGTQIKTRVYDMPTDVNSVSKVDMAEEVR